MKYVKFERIESVLTVRDGWILRKLKGYTFTNYFLSHSGDIKKIGQGSLVFQDNKFLTMRKKKNSHYVTNFGGLTNKLDENEVCILNKSPDKFFTKLILQKSDPEIAGLIGVSDKSVGIIVHNGETKESKSLCFSDDGFDLERNYIYGIKAYLHQDQQTLMILQPYHGTKLLILDNPLI